MGTPDWLRRRMNMPCTIHSRIDAGKDEYGNQLYGDVATDTVCYLQPFNQVEIMEGRAAVATFLCMLPSEVAGVLDNFAWLDVDDQSYEADEPPATYPSFFTAVHHVELVVRKGTA